VNCVYSTSVWGLLLEDLFQDLRPKVKPSNSAQIGNQKFSEHSPTSFSFIHATSTSSYLNACNSRLFSPLLFSVIILERIFYSLIKLKVVKKNRIELFQVSPFDNLNPSSTNSVDLALCLVSVNVSGSRSSIFFDKYFNLIKNGITCK
jgi:hypothetical protein